MNISPRGYFPISRYVIALVRSYASTDNSQQQKIPIQFLAAESELLWTNKYEAEPKFRKLVKFLTGAPEVEAEILEGGGHNYEFCLSVSKLWELRRKFVERVVS